MLAWQRVAMAGMNMRPDSAALPQGAEATHQTIGVHPDRDSWQSPKGFSRMRHMSAPVGELPRKPWPVKAQATTGAGNSITRAQHQNAVDATSSSRPVRARSFALASLGMYGYRSRWQNRDGGGDRGRCHRSPSRSQVAAKTEKDHQHLVTIKSASAVPSIANMGGSISVTAR